MPVIVSEVGSSNQRGQKDSDVRSQWGEPHDCPRNQIRSSPVGTEAEAVCMHDEYSCMRTPVSGLASAIVCLFLFKSITQATPRPRKVMFLALAPRIL